MPHFRTSSGSTNEFYDGKHRFEHWYRDNTVYFITARCRAGVHAFAEDRAKAIFWDRFEHYAKMHGFVPWVVSLLINHYHALGYLRIGEELGPMMRKIHGSVAKLVNDTLEVRLVPFWCDHKFEDYFDGCIRDVLQARRAYRYTLTQCTRHGVCHDPKDYPHTRVYIDVDRAVRRAVEINAFLSEVPYARYERKRRGH